MKFILAVVLVISSVNGFHIKRNSPAPTIIGGQNAKRGQFPHMVSLQMHGNHHCGAGILSPTWVVTAAHCVYRPTGLEIVAGLLNVKESHPDNQRIAPQRVIEHPDHEINLHDISLIELQSALVFNEVVQPIALPKPNQEFNGKATVSGWGRISVVPSEYATTLQYLAMPIITVDDCNKRLRSIGKYPWLITEVHICTLPEKLGESGCHADSGSPLIQNTENGNVIVGIVHGGDPACGHGLAVTSPNIFTKVSHYLDFITSHVDDLL